MTMLCLQIVNGITSYAIGLLCCDRANVGVLFLGRMGPTIWRVALIQLARQWAPINAKQPTEND